MTLLIIVVLCAIIVVLCAIIGVLIAIDIGRLYDEDRWRS